MNDEAGPRILIVEDHELLGQTVALTLRSDGMVVEQAPDLDADAVLALADDFGPDIVLLDLQLGEPGHTGLPLIKPLAERGASVLVVTGVTDPRRLGECLEAGAVGVLGKDKPFERLVEAVHNITEMRDVMSRDERSDLLGAMRRDRADEERRWSAFRRLTPREQAVLAGLMAGKSAETMAAEWVVSLATVRSQIRSVLTKLGVNSQLGAVAMARQVGWTGPEE
jgi:two-component system, NarL family, nitrate/nitrite response regulator NarL